MKPQIRTAARLALSAGALFLLNLPASAGTGRVRTSGGGQVLDFCVSVRFAASSSELANIQRALTDAGAVLADATDGQYSFGTIDIVTGSGAGLEAEIWIKPEAGSAYATCGSYGVPGDHITLYYPTNCTGTPAVEGDAYTIAHEMGHHLWGLKDEYAGPGGPAECEPLPGSPTASFSLMDNFFARGGNDGFGTGTYTLNEFCVGSNHDPDLDTAQHAHWGASCWDRIAAHPTRPLVPPAGLPVDAAPAVAAPVFRTPVAERRFVLLLDASNEGTAGEPLSLTYAKQAARLFVDLTEPGDQLAVVSFTNNATVQYPLTSILGSADRAAAKAAIDAITAAPSTAIGRGLIAARDQILAPGTVACTQHIFLMSDGVNNVGPGELSVIPSLVDAGIAVFTFALQQPPKLENLGEVAVQTGGTYSAVPVLEELPGLLASRAAETSDAGVAKEDMGTFLVNGDTYSSPVRVEQGATKAEFIVFWPDFADSIELSVEAPDGTIYTAADSTNPDIQFLSSPGVQVLTVDGSLVDDGDWIMTPGGKQVGTDGGSFCLSAHVGNTAVSMPADVSQPSFAPGQPLLVTATPRFQGNSVAGATVGATVQVPGSGNFPMTLFDDGNPAHGDDIAGDGTYSGYFPLTAAAGLYLIDVAADNLAGTTYGGEALYASVGAPVFTEPAPAFTRRADLTASVQLGVGGGSTAPIATCGADTTVNATSASGATVQLTAAVADPNGDALAVQWKVNGVVASTQNLPPGGAATMIHFTHAFTVGAHLVEVSAADETVTTTCSMTVTVVDSTPPSLSVTLNRTVLFPPNQALMNINAQVTVTDNVDTAPTWVVSSATSDEIDCCIGPADKPGDIRQVSLGTPDLKYELRAERDPAGDGRVYTIVYTATDAAGNSVDVPVTVTCPAGFSGGTANSADGYTQDGSDLMPGAASYRLVIPGSSTMDAAMVEQSLTYVGNGFDALAPVSSTVVDATGDGVADMVAEFDAPATVGIRANGIVALCWTSDGVTYLVDDIFALGSPLVTPTGVPEGTPATIALGRPVPNPFSAGSRVSFAVPGPGGQSVDLAVYDVTGRLVRRLVDEVRNPGTYTQAWDGRSDGGKAVPSGVYFYRLVVAGEERTVRTIRLR
jgi:hypothetical protein